MAKHTELQKFHALKKLAIRKCLYDRGYLKVFEKNHQD